MSIWLRERDLAGFSSYMQTKSQEERGHADRLIAYLVDSDEQVELPSVDAPQRSWTSAQTLFDDVYEMEQAVTASINRIYSTAEKAGERSATAMLDWFVAEQLQEEAEARFVRKRLRLANMKEVISKWNIYIVNNKCLTQRGATFLIDESNNLLYSFYSKGLLGYSDNMAQPLGFLEPLLSDID